MAGANKRLWIDSLVVGILGLLLTASLYMLDWLPPLIGVGDSAFALHREETALLGLFILLASFYLIVRSATGQSKPAQQAAPVVQEARALSILIDDFLHKLGTPESTPPYVKSALDQAQAITQSTGWALHLVEGDELVYTYAGGAAPPNMGKENLHTSVAGQAVRENRPVLVAETRSDPRFAGALPGQVPYQSLLVLPISYGSRVLGTLRLVHPEPRRFTDASAESVRPIALLLGAALWRANDVDERASLQRERADAVARADAYERRFDTLATRVDRGILLLDPAREQVVFANERAAAITGRSTEMLLANPRNLTESIHPEDRARVEKEAATDASLDYRILRGGETVWVHEERATIRNPKGQVAGFLLILGDETRGRQIEHEFETVQRRLGFPLEDAPLVFYALSPGGNYGMTFVSPNAEKVLGHRAGDFLADPGFWTSQLHPDDHAKVFGDFPVLFQKGTLRHQYRFRHADGSYRILDDVMTLVRTPDGQPLEIVGYWVDVTERIRLQEGVNYSLNRVKELQDSRTRLLNTISHDLSNPITPIRLQLALLEPALKGTPQARNLDIVARNVETVNRLIQDLKDVARLEAGKLRVDPAPGDIMATVQAAVESFQGAAIAKGIVLESRLGPALTMPFDEQRITQVLFNFLGNAMKFTPDRGQISVEAKQEASNVVVRVTDSGRGLSPDEQGRLFKPFSQVHDRSEIKEKGTGLGLYICKGLIESHGGRVFVESKGRGKGSTFGFTLPVTGASADAGSKDAPPVAPMADALPVPGAGAPRPAAGRKPRSTKPRTRKTSTKGSSKPRAPRRPKDGLSGQ